MAIGYNIELVQLAATVTLVWLWTRTGEDFEMTYEVKIEGYDAVVATAGSRKIAEQTAAASLLELLQERTSGS